MSTPAMIAQKVTTGYECIRVNWDGHLESVGAGLAKYFDTNEEVRDLIALGDCSSVVGAKNLREVVSYHRDRGEDWADVKPEHFATLAEAIDFYGNQQFNYVWEDRIWSAYSQNGDQLDW